ncbi:hypothetical protein VST7929_01068 [Vibrio stylophorae]|uniref:Thioredoxin domain-containing protein n=1 Tax=Vibrio stylophorae TaxID=659351 RepID=A0ABM8ZST5_9VIBR|nr:redoxin domain-containing protein [Vibrio stylophorae]CAH0533206.1 hypothetical protein VST7929_01068 [Vibrio stylophorae]
MSTDYTPKCHPSTPFPKFHVSLAEGQNRLLVAPQEDCDWQLVVVYRGAHCPLCTKFLNRLAGFKPQLKAIGVDIIAVSADSAEQLARHQEKLSVNFPIAYGLSKPQMHQLGLYISIPRSPQETDHDFPEPGLFVVNEAGNIQVVDLSNNPFSRPDLEALVSGLTWIRDPDNHYPIRGTAHYNDCALES